jgi:vacuolar iron transporter family protein
VPLSPWFFASGAAAKVMSLLLGVVAAVVVGVLVARSTGRPVLRAVGRQVAFTVIPAAVTFAIGSALGVGTT